MTIQEVVAGLQKEKQAHVPSRFPCRAIMVNNIRQYCELLSELKKISDIHFAQAQELFTNADVMPKYENMKDSKYADKWVILTGVSEYLRLFLKSEMNDRRFAALWSHQVPASSVGRIIIPLWGCEVQWFDNGLNLMGDLRQSDFYYNCINRDREEEPSIKLTVLSWSLEKYISNLETMKGDLKIGLREWFEYWLDPVPEKTEFILLTKRSGSVNTTVGNSSVNVISDILTLIRENMHPPIALTTDNCTVEMQDLLLEYALRGDTLDTAILGILNMSTFSQTDIIERWNALPPSHKRFVKMWYELHPDSSYLCYCFSVIDSIEQLPDAAMHEIFKHQSDRSDWVSGFYRLALGKIFTADEHFFEQLDKIPVYEKRLDFLTGNSRSERNYLLRMVGEWARVDRNQVISSEKLKQIYPELFAYLRDESLSFGDEIKLYLSRYKSYKLENTLPEDEEIYFNGVQTDIYDKRYTVLSEFRGGDTIFLWIDALGIEWFSLLKWSLSDKCDATVIHEAIVQADLPTETKYNDQWKKTTDTYEKLDRLDKLAHKGMSFFDDKDYYSCIQEQFKFVSEKITKRVNELLKKYKRVVITSDHGTSRLAARFFHTRDAMPLPKNAQAYNHGRYCLLPQGAKLSMPDICLVKDPDGNQYAVFSNYDHFPMQGFATGESNENVVYGEIHGGATPEEMLLPVIVLEGKNEIKLTGKWAKDTVKISMKKVKLHIGFNKPVHGLNVRIAGIDGDTLSDSDGKNWSIIFKGLKQGSYVVQVCADNKILDMPDITIKSALSGEGDLP